MSISDWKASKQRQVVGDSPSDSPKKGKTTIDAAPSSSPAKKKGAPPADEASRAHPVCHVGVAAFIPTNSDELPIAPGDLVYVTNKPPEGGWWQGVLNQGEEPRWFPQNHVSNNPYSELLGGHGSGSDDRLSSSSTSPSPPLDSRSKEASWFIVGLSREEVKILAKHLQDEAPVGAFLIREPQSQPDCLGLILKGPEKLVNVLINPETTCMKLGSISKPTLWELIDYFATHKTQLPVKLIRHYIFPPRATTKELKAQEKRLIKEQEKEKEKEKISSSSSPDAKKKPKSKKLADGEERETSPEKVKKEKSKSKLSEDASLSPATDDVKPKKPKVPKSAEPDDVSAIKEKKPKKKSVPTSEQPVLPLPMKFSSEHDPPEGEEFDPHSSSHQHGNGYVSPREALMEQQTRERVERELREKMAAEELALRELKVKEQELKLAEQRKATQEAKERAERDRFEQERRERERIAQEMATRDQMERERIERAAREQKEKDILHLQQQQLLREQARLREQEQARQMELRQREEDERIMKERAMHNNNTTIANAPTPPHAGFRPPVHTTPQQPSPASSPKTQQKHGFSVPKTHTTTSFPVAPHSNPVSTLTVSLPPAASPNLSSNVLNLASSSSSSLPPNHLISSSSSSQQPLKKIPLVLQSASHHDSHTDGDMSITSNELVTFVVGPNGDLRQGDLGKLKAKSPYFHNLKGGTRVPFLALTVEPFEFILSYLYTGVLPAIPFDLAFDIHRGSSLMLLNDLRQACETLLLKNICVESVVHLLVQSVSYEISLVANACTVFIEENPVDVFGSSGFLDIPKQSFIALLKSDGLCLKEDDVWRAVVAWGKYHAAISQDDHVILGNKKGTDDDDIDGFGFDDEVKESTSHSKLSEEQKEELRETLVDVLPLIRIFLIPLSFFSEEVEPVGVISPQASSDRYRYERNSVYFDKNDFRARPRAQVIFFKGSILLSAQHQQILNEWYGKKEQRWRLLYRASQDGYGADAFHTKCDHRRNTFVIVQSANGCLFGGFTDQQWDSSRKFKGAPAGKSFLFSLLNTDQTPPRKFDLIDPQYAIRCFPSYGPEFGGNEMDAHDLHISSNCNLNDESYCNLPCSYLGEHASNGCLAGSTNFLVADYEVFGLYAALHTETEV